MVEYEKSYFIDVKKYGPMLIWKWHSCNIFAIRFIIIWKLKGLFEDMIRFTIKNFELHIKANQTELT